MFATIAAACAFAATGPGSATAATISGTVSDEHTHAGIAGVEVCPTPQPYTFEVDCVGTDSAGNYTIGGLAPASYEIEFAASSPSLNYVREWYGGDQEPPGDLVSVDSYDDAVHGIDAELEPGGLMKGTATDATTGGPAGKVWVCVEADPPVFYGTCAQANDAGEFVGDDLPTGEYRVSFGGWSDVNYLHRYYKNADSFAAAASVAVVAGETVSGIDELLYPGAQIFGRVANVETGEPLYEARVCASPTEEENAEYCDATDLDGGYAIRSLPAGSYFVKFGAENGPFGPTVGQWWDHTESQEDAKSITVEPPETVTGIDGSLPWYFGQEPPGPEAPLLPLQATSPATRLKAPLRPCRKGFHRKLVKSKRRCVRKHHRHRGHPRHRH
jgi:hypothetical protein